MKEISGNFIENPVPETLYMKRKVNNIDPSFFATKKNSSE